MRLLGAGLLLAAVAVCITWWPTAPVAAPNAGAPAVGDAVTPATANEQPPSISREQPGPAATGYSAASATASGLQGRLLLGGQPIAGASVSAVARFTTSADGIGAQTGADGRFLLLLEPELYRLEVRGAGVPRDWQLQNLSIGPRQVLDLGDLAVPEPVRVTGRVVDETGRPMSGVRVYVKSREGNFRHAIVDPDAADADANALTANALTDGAGRFVIGGLLPGKVEARAEHPGRRAWQQDTDVFVDGVADVGDIVLRPADSLRGFVVDGRGAPVQGATVTPGGGRYEQMHPRQATVTRADGGFELIGFGNHSSLTVLGQGQAPTVLDRIDRQQQPVRITMATANPVYGRVVGAEGLVGTFRVDSPSGRYRDLPTEVSRFLDVPLPLAEHGTFWIDHVPAGTWQISARVPGLGSVPPQTIELPLSQPLELQPVPDLAVEVTVVDELDAPVAFANLVRVATDHPEIYTRKSAEQNGRAWLSWWLKERSATDTNGRATVSVPVHEPLMLAVTADMHVVTSVIAAAGSVPASVRIVLARAGTVRGRLIDASLRAHVGMRVQVSGLTPAADGKPPGTNCAVDGAGSFHSAPVPPGRYSLTLVLVDASEHDVGRSVRELPVPDPVPLLADYASVIVAIEVEVLPAQETVVEVPAPVVGEVKGRVLAAGQAVPGAFVYGSFGDAKDRIVGPEELDAHRYSPHCRTDGEGRFRFFVAVRNEIELRARRPSSPAWSQPAKLQVARGAVVERDIGMPAACVRGSFDMSTVAPADREFFTAQLYPLAKAGADPFAAAHHSSSIEFEVQRQVLGNAGTFAFEALQPGTWVLRLVGRRDEIVLQRVVQTVGDERIEFGRLDRPERVEVRLACGLTAVHAVHVNRVVPGESDTVFVATVTRGSGPAWQWPALEPGRYHLQAIERWQNSWGLGVIGDDCGEPVTIEVLPDGSATPAEVWPNGL